MKKIMFLLLVSLQVSGQDFAVKKGFVTDSLMVSDSIAESFAIYLPTDFRADRQWPALFVFDQEGRGKAAAQLFKAAAEQQGYVVISSNDIDQSRSLVENVSTAARLIRSSYSNMPLDPNQIVATGSGEGAKVASALPFVLKDIFGVVAVGNHWVNFKFLDKDRDFVFIGLVGDEQYTSTGMKITARTLKDFQFPSQLYTYSGDKEWPNVRLIGSAVSSLTLQAMREGLRPMDTSLVNSFYKKDLHRVNKLMSSGQLLRAGSFLELMEEKYEDLRETEAVANRQEQLEGSRNYRRQRREQEEISEKEGRLLNDFVYYMKEDLRTLNFENLGWWNYQKKELDSMSRKPGAEGKMGERLLGYVSELAYISRKQLEKQKAGLEPLLLANLIQTIFDPKAFEAYKNIISLSVRDNDFPTALFYLEEMLKHGYSDKEALYNIEGTLGLKLTPEFNGLIEKYLGSSRYYDREVPEVNNEVD